jgi:hypothetical protein
MQRATVGSEGCLGCRYVRVWLDTVVGCAGQRPEVTRRVRTERQGYAEDENAKNESFWGIPYCLPIIFLLDVEKDRRNICCTALTRIYWFVFVLIRSTVILIRL